MPDLTDRQHLALAHHCRFAFETAHPRFGGMDPTRRFTTVLTVNSGYE